GLSLTILTGWGGQLSLGQMAFAGIGALLAAAFARGINVELGIGDTRIFRSGIVPLPFGVSIILAALITAALAVVIGVGALRVRGLLPAVGPFAFGVAASQSLSPRPFLIANFGQSVPFRRTDLFGLDIRTQRTYYYVVLAVLAVAIAVVGRLRRTGIGRTTI